tara:strand:+ start:190 stop:426 length:237 start_codon:yes stop_codon:yes gene_type:complete
MVQVLREISKVVIIILTIVVLSVILSDRPLEAKANKLIKDKLSLHENLTREERDQYMLYLRSLNTETNDSIYSIELPQ